MATMPAEPAAPPTTATYEQVLEYATLMALRQRAMVLPSLTDDAAARVTTAQQTYAARWTRSA